MPQMWFWIFLAIVVMIPAAVAMHIRLRGPVRATVLAGTVLIVWFVFVASVFVVNDFIQRQKEAEVELDGGYASVEDALDDGVGDNAIVLACGWLPATLGLAIGILLRRASVWHPAAVQQAAVAGRRRR